MAKILLALGLTIASMSSQALTVTIFSGQFNTLRADATTIDFDSALPAGVVSITGGALYTAPTQPGISAVPVGSTGNYYSVGISPDEQAGPGIVTLDGLASYYGFLWGSIETHNTVELYNGDALVGSISGESFTPNDGNELVSAYLNIFAENSSEFFNKIVFSSTLNAFETDNHAFVSTVSAVPVPAALPLMASALGAFGIARRRNKSKTI